ncbi:MAG: acyl carrier protein [Bryobacterales bacterium]|nr:acyl carrier protein [Bryobacterales bacterium]
MLDQIRSIIADLFGIPLEQVLAETSPDTVDQWDSIQHLNLVLALEHAFNLQFTPEEMEQMLSVELIAALVEEKCVALEES